MASEPKLTDAQKAAISVCPQCGVAVYSHNDLGRTLYPKTCALTVIAARAAAVAAIVGEHTQALKAEVSEALACYAAEQERYAEAVVARDAHFEARNRMIEQSDHWRARAEAAQAEVQRLRALLDGEA